MSYIKLNKNQLTRDISKETDNYLIIENNSSLVRFDHKNKIILYFNKIDPKEYLQAQYIDGKWSNVGSNISKSKEKYFLNVVDKEILNLTTKHRSKNKKKL